MTQIEKSWAMHVYSKEEKGEEEDKKRLNITKIKQRKKKEKFIPRQLLNCHLN